MDELALVEGLRARNTEAQQEFWERYWPRVYSICVRILGKGLDSMDLAVDLMTDFIERRVMDIKDPKAVGAYLRLMAIRRSMDLKEKRRLATQLDFDIGDTSVDTPEEQAVYGMLVPRLDNCLSVLSEKAQQTIRLKYTEQWTNEYIGSIVGGSKQYIGRLIRKSLELLKNCIEKNANFAEMARDGK